MSRQIEALRSHAGFPGAFLATLQDLDSRLAALEATVSGLPPMPDLVSALLDANKRLQVLEANQGAPSPEWQDASKAFDDRLTALEGAQVDWVDQMRDVYARLTALETSLQSTGTELFLDAGAEGVKMSG